MDFFFVLTMRFLSDGTLHTETLMDTIVASGEDTVESLFWRAYASFKERYGCESYGVVECWSIMPDALPRS